MAIAWIYASYAVYKIKYLTELSKKTFCKKNRENTCILSEAKIKWQTSTIQ